MQPQKELQLDLKTNNTQNHQKIKLYGSPTTKNLKKPHSFRRVGGAEGQRGRDTETGREAQRCGVARRRGVA